MRIVFLGAGLIGCFVGGCWHAAGLNVAFFGRRSVAGEIAQHGLALSDHTGWQRNIPAKQIDFSFDPSILANADIVVVTVKSTATDDAAVLIAKHAHPEITVLSLQNGISNVDLLRERLPHHPILAGMVGFNVIRSKPGHWHKATSGEIVCQSAPATAKIAELSASTPAALSITLDMTSVAWGKLLLNLNNAINALSGQTLLEQLSDQSYRRVLAASLREALSVLGAANIKPAKVAPLPPWLLPRFIDTPDWFFRSVGLRLQKIDATARSSMADDFLAGRPSEIDYLNGEIVKLADEIGYPSPINRKIVEMVKAAETGGKKCWTGKELLQALGM